MKKLKLGCILLLGFIPLGLLGQNTVDQLAKEDFWRLQQKKGTTRIDFTYSQIQGTPFLNASFQTGQIFTKGDRLFGSYPLRYNVYTENFEFRKSDKQILELNMPGLVDKIKLDDTTFVYTAYRDNKSVENGFFQLLNSGRAEGLIRYSVEFIKAIPPGAYQDAQPAQFSPIEKDLYVRFGQGPAIKIYKNSDFIKALPGNKSQVVRFMKKERIHASREKELLKLLKYYNSL